MIHTHRSLALFVCLLGLVPILSAQERTPERERIRRQKIETILRIQDRRTIYDQELVQLLSDRDPIVRERAVRAYGSIQDTSVMSILVDCFQNDELPSVQRAAAFAIGQTAGLMSAGTRKSLEHDIIWTRMEYSKAPLRMIEELGKFGSEEGLKDLILKFGEDPREEIDSVLTLSIARYAIRGITHPTAIEHLLSRVVSAHRITWQRMYALQRIGAKEMIRAEVTKLAPMFQNADQLVRMNLAVLLGKIKDERSCIEPLRKLAEYDSDWQVRVAAFRALGNFHLTKLPDVLPVFRRAMNEQTWYVALTAITALGNSDIDLTDSSEAVKELREALLHVARNESGDYRWQIQSEAAISAAKRIGASAFRFIDLKHPSHRLLGAQLIQAAGLTGAPEAETAISAFLQGDDKLLQRAALEGLQELIRKNPKSARLKQNTRQAALKALASEDMAVVTTAAALLGDSLLQDPASVKPLIDKLAVLRIPDDVEAIQEVISTLGKLKSSDAVQPLERKLEAPDRSIVMAAAAALTSITGRDYSSKIALRFEPLYTDFDFAYLWSLPESVRVKMETSQGEVLMEFYRDVAPFTVMNVAKLAMQKGFYRGLTFHRVVPTFVIQGGDPRGDGWGGPGFAIRSEFSDLTYERGTLGIASAGKDTEGSQFFITQTPQPHLDGRYTIFGKVITGFDVVDRIQIDDRIFEFKVIP